MRTVRFLPLVALAAFSLLSLKIAGLLLGHKNMVTGSAPSIAKAIPDAPRDSSKKKPKVDSSKKKPKVKDTSLAPKRIGAKKITPKDIVSLSGDDHRSKAERNLLISLSKRREQLDAREKELGLRLNLIKAAEKRIDQRIDILKELDTKIQRFAKVQEEKKKTQFAMLVKMYSSMKPKGAALIFNELDKKVLLGIMKNMKPQAMSAILAAMAPVKARQITISLAGIARQKFTEKNLDDLPKINGK
ncbi:MAG: hypothetical protein GY927_20105 [bacterium]|nr:hypothetical protein [bacterium]